MIIEDCLKTINQQCHSMVLEIFFGGGGLKIVKNVGEPRSGKPKFVGASRGLGAWSSGNFSKSRFSETQSDSFCGIKMSHSFPSFMIIFPEV